MDIISRLGKVISPSLADLILNTALKALAGQEAGGFGMMGNGRYKAGAPVRTTAGSVHGSLHMSQVSPADVEAVLDRNLKAKREGNKVFYSL
jgi:hypothetical protein